MNAQNPIATQPVAPPNDVTYAHKLGRGRLLPAQIAELATAINPAYVEKKQNMTYLAQHQARAEMNRIFGYGNWSSHVEEMTLMYETNQPGTGNKSDKMYWVVGYRAKVTVDIRDRWGMPVTSFSEYHAEENAPQPNRGEANALAMTSVESYALRRALIGLGDRFGLGLYAGGSTGAHGQYTIQQYPGLLYTYEQQPAPQQAPAPQQQQQQQQQPIPPHQQPGDMQDFHQVQQQMQGDREQQRAAAPVTPDMQSRIQNQMKVDNTFDGTGVGEN